MVAAVSLGCRVLLATVFAGSAASKVSSRARFESFCDWLANLHRDLVNAAKPIGFTVVVAEAATALSLGLSLTGRRGSHELALAGSLLAAGLLLVFANATAILIRRGSGTRCMCFGSEGAPLSRRHVIRDLVLMSAAGIGFADTSPGLPLAEQVLLVEIGVAVGMAVMFLDDIVSVFSRWPHGLEGVVRR
jgi:Methylamine utilisation protein MauE